jgi:NAD(P)-dependent dehydrogenase (short-subunit alcohol dehydrogenase family)
MALKLNDPSKRTILITGGNRGIGLEAVRQLLNYGQSNVIATARDPERATELVGLLKDHSNFHVEKLDVAISESRQALSERLADLRLDVLINNAGVYTGGKTPVHDARLMMETNYFGPKELSRLLKKNMKSDDALVINVSSDLGALSGFSTADQSTLLDTNLSEESLDEMVMQYINGQQPGWPKDPYHASKGVLNTLSRIRNRQGQTMVCVSPGWVRTEMGGSNANLSVEEGTETIVWLARGLADVPGGKHFKAKNEISW